MYLSGVVAVVSSGSCSTYILYIVRIGNLGPKLEGFLSFSFAFLDLSGENGIALSLSLCFSHGMKEYLYNM